MEARASTLNLGPIEIARVEQGADGGLDSRNRAGPRGEGNPFSIGDRPAGQAVVASGESLVLTTVADASRPYVNAIAPS